MEQRSVNLLDLLDELRELSHEQQQKRLNALPTQARDQLIRWLEAGQQPIDPFDARPNALAGLDSDVVAGIAQVREPRFSAEDERHGTTRSIDSPPGDSGPDASDTRRPAKNGRLNFHTGDVLQKQYRIVCQLGRGGMGEVFRAIDEHTGEQVALKFLPADRMANPQALALLKSEVRVAHRIRSPYVCAVHGLHLDTSPVAGQPPLPPFIAMQFIEGEDLHTLLKRVERLSGPKVLRIANELAKGMAAIHAAGILHRDLKPSNVMLDPTGTVQILDFGIASLANPGADDGSAIIAGTPAYMAPEARTQAATAVSDIYAVGLMLFELSTGQVASSLLRDEPDSGALVERFKDQIPRELVEPISRCLRRNPIDRFQSMEELIRALPAPPAVKERSESITTIARSDAVPPLRQWMAIAMIVFIVAAAIGVFFTPPPAGSVAATHLTRHPFQLAEAARQVAKVLDGDSEPHEVHGFAAAAPTENAGRAGPRRNGLLFWYRCGPTVFEAANAMRGVTNTDPPSAPGTTAVRLDPAGMLIDAWRLPDVHDAALNYTWNGNDTFPPALAAQLEGIKQITGPVQYPFTFIRGSGLPGGWTPPAPLPSATDYWLDSTKPSADPAALGPMLVAALGDRILYIGRVRNHPAPTIATETSAAQPPAAFSWIDLTMQRPMGWLMQHTKPELAFWWMYALPVFGLALAIRNVRLRRCDTRHALRVAGLVFTLSLFGWILTTHPGLSGKTLNDRWNAGIGMALFVGAQAWISYAAVDPYARSTWKRCLIGYARFTTGWHRVLLRDVIVGRSLLAGAAFGLALALLLKTLDLWTLNAGVIASREQTAAMLVGDGWRTAGLLFRAASSAIVFSLLQFVTLVLLHWLTRKRWVAIALFCVVTPLLWAVYRNDFTFPAYLIYPVIGILTAIVLIHEGVLAHAVGLFFSTVLTTVPLTFDSSSPNFGMSMMVLLLLGAYVVVGFLAVVPKTNPLRWLPSDPLTVRVGDTSQAV